jgi:plastocyanin domain-containing protein
MTAKIVVTVLGLALLFFVNWYFLLSKNSRGKKGELNK